MGARSGVREFPNGNRVFAWKCKEFGSGEVWREMEEGLIGIREEGIGSRVERNQDWQEVVGKEQGGG